MYLDTNNVYIYICFFGERSLGQMSLRAQKGIRDRSAMYIDMYVYIYINLAIERWENWEIHKKTMGKKP